jgi:hypothetical protein
MRVNLTRLRVRLSSYRGPPHVPPLYRSLAPSPTLSAPPLLPYSILPLKCEVCGKSPRGAGAAIAAQGDSEQDHWEQGNGIDTVRRQDSGGSSPAQYTSLGAQQRPLGARALFPEAAAAPVSSVATQPPIPTNSAAHFKGPTALLTGQPAVATEMPGLAGLAGAAASQTSSAHPSSSTYASSGASAVQRLARQVEQGPPATPSADTAAQPPTTLAGSAQVPADRSALSHVAQEQPMLCQIRQGSAPSWAQQVDGAFHCPVRAGG